MRLVNQCRDANTKLSLRIVSLERRTGFYDVSTPDYPIYTFVLTLLDTLTMRK